MIFSPRSLEALGGVGYGSAPDVERLWVSMDDVRALSRLIGTRPCLDIIGVSLTRVGGYEVSPRINVQSLNSELADANVKLPIAITQLSYSTAGPRAYTDDQQAEALVSSYEVLRRIADIPIVLVSRLLDNGDGSKVQGFGVLRANGAKKLAYCELAKARGAPTPPGCA